MERKVEIGLMSSLAMKAALIELTPRFELESGHPVLAQWVGGVEIARRLRAGDPSDLIIMAALALDELAEEGLLARGSRVDLVRSTIGVAVRAGAPRPDISSGGAVKRAVEAAKSVAYSSGPSGVYLIEVFKRWKIPADKLHQAAPGKPSGEFVARGECEICFQQISELLPVKGIDYIGPLPEDLQLVTVFSAGTNARAKQPEVAKALVRFLTSPAVVPVLAKHGLEPASC